MHQPTNFRSVSSRYHQRGSKEQPSTMSSVNSINSTPQFQGASLNGRATERLSSEPKANGRVISDEVSISDTARRLDQSDAGEIRRDLVDRIRTEIASGKYETTDKLDRAVEELARRLGA